MQRKQAVWILAACLCIIAHLSFFPWNFGPRKFALWWVWPAIRTRTDAMDVLLNVWLYLPVGFIGYFAFGRGRRALAAITLLGTAFSVGVEWTQMWLPSRFTSGRDVVTNALGTSAGAGLAWLLTQPHVKRRTRGWLTRPAWRITREGSVLLVLWIVWRGFPLFPVLRMPRIRAALEALVTVSGSPLEAAHTAAGFLVLALALGPSVWLWIALAMLPLEGFLRGHVFSWWTVAGGLIGLLLANLLRYRTVGNAAAWAVWLWFAIDQFRPFQLDLNPKPFTWIPVAGYFGTGDSYYITVFGKLYLFAAGLWFLRRSGWSLLTATSFLFALIASGEWAQRYLTGRTPESIDPLLVLLAALVLAQVHSAPAVHGKEQLDGGTSEAVAVTPRRG